jgi:hypothetical protein
MPSKIKIDPFPDVFCGITSMTCQSCSFEFVYVEPEEKERAMQVISQHINDYHHADYLATEVTVLRH